MFIKPMLLQEKEQPFSDPRYIYEMKADGIRVILSHINGQTKIFTRHKTDCTDRFPELLNVPVEGDCVLDGELVVLDEQGAIEFELVMQRFQTTNPFTIQSTMKRLKVVYLVFDILHYRGQDLRGLPLMQRKEILESALTDNAYFAKMRFVEEHGEALFEQIRAKGLEGQVSKLKDSTYVSSRSWDWIKTINWSYADVWISGYRKDKFGWLVSVEGERGLRAAGVVELGVPPTHRKALYGISRQLITGEDKHYVHLEPKIRAKVKFRNWTRKGLLRIPVFVDFILEEAGG